MTPRERYINTVLGRPIDRPAFVPFFWRPWPTTWDRWKREGMPCSDLDELRRFLDCDPSYERVPVNCGPCPAIEPRTIADDGQYRVWTDTWGIKRRNPVGAESMSQFLEFPVKGWDDWRKFKAERLDPRHPQRLAGDWRSRCAGWMKQELPIRLGYFPDVGVFGSVRWLLGDEECLLAFYTEPDLVRDIMNTMTDIYVAVFEAVASQVRVDEIHIWEDMSGRQGPLISPAHWEEFMGPCYRRIRAVAQKHHVPLTSVDTDGNPDLIIPPMLNNGVNMIFPMEVAAGCDINVFLKKHPAMGFLGGIDKRALAASEEAIDRELARIAPAVSAGRFLPSPDHLIPDDVSWHNFQYFSHALKKLVGKP
jgi:uroporphyrinogen decarboxylase